MELKATGKQFTCRGLLYNIPTLERTRCYMAWSFAQKEKEGREQIIFHKR